VQRQNPKVKICLIVDDKGLCDDRAGKVEKEMIIREVYLAPLKNGS